MYINSSLKSVFKKAFSLAELLICVFIVSILMVAFAPVITKRAQNKATGKGSKVNFEIFTPFTSPMLSTCSQVQTDSETGAQYKDCTFKVNGQKINAYIVGAGGSGAGATYAKVKSYNRTTSSPQEITQIFSSNLGVKDVVLSQQPRNRKYGDEDSVSYSYKQIFPAVGGSGGAGGGYAHIENIPVNKNLEFIIRIGIGGNISPVDANGTKGGASGIIVGSQGYLVGGGEGGRVGKSANSLTSPSFWNTSSNPVQGGFSLFEDATFVKEQKAGENGFSAGFDSDYITNSIPWRSFGGNGGRAGIALVNNVEHGQMSAGCGGFSFAGSSSACFNPSKTGSELPFVMPYGSSAQAAPLAGAGGGGGGFNAVEIISDYSGSKTSQGSGEGARGQDGYVYIYWNEVH